MSTALRTAPFLLLVASMTPATEPQPQPKPKDNPAFPLRVTLRVTGPNGKGEVVTENVPARFEMPGKFPLWVIDASNPKVPIRPKKGGTVTEADGTAWVIESVSVSGEGATCVCSKQAK